METTQKFRKTYANVESISYRTKAVESLLGVSGKTLREYTEVSGVKVRRANEFVDTAVPVRVFDVQNVFDLATWRRKMGYLKGLGADRPIVIAVNVIKGGTGKTTTTVETAVALQLQGLRVLCIDLDVQANLTQSMGYESDLVLEEAAIHGLDVQAIVTNTFADVVLPFINQGAWRKPIVPMNDIVKKPFGENGPHLIPADTMLADLDSAMVNSRGARELIYQAILRGESKSAHSNFDASKYDVIILDCPPSVSMTNANALAAADIIIAPVRMDSFSVKGLNKLILEIKALQMSYKEVTPEIFILPTHYAGNIARTARMQSELAKYGSMLSQQVISTNEDFPKTQESYIPLTLVKPTSKGAVEYMFFTKLLRERMTRSILKKIKRSQKS